MYKMNSLLLKSTRSVLAALMTEFLGNQPCDRQPCKPVMVIMGYAISVKVIKVMWDVLISTHFNNTSTGAIKNRCPSASSVLNSQGKISFKR